MRFGWQFHRERGCWETEGRLHGDAALHLGLFRSPLAQTLTPSELHETGCFFFVDATITDGSSCMWVLKSYPASVGVVVFVFVVGGMARYCCRRSCGFVARAIELFFSRVSRAGGCNSPAHDMQQFQNL